MPIRFVSCSGGLDCQTTPEGIICKSKRKPRTARKRRIRRKRSVVLGKVIKRHRRRSRKGKRKAGRRRRSRKVQLLV